LDKLLNKIKEYKEVTIDTETTSLNIIEAKLV
jgi:ribonuclease D